MIQNTVSYLHCKIKSQTILLKNIYHPKTLLTMIKAQGTYLIKCPLTGMLEYTLKQVPMDIQKL